MYGAPQSCSRVDFTGHRLDGMEPYLPELCSRYCLLPLWRGRYKLRELRYGGSIKRHDAKAEEGSDKSGWKVDKRSEYAERVLI